MNECQSRSKVCFQDMAEEMDTFGVSHHRCHEEALGRRVVVCPQKLFFINECLRASSLKGEKEQRPELDKAMGRASARMLCPWARVTMTRSVMSTNMRSAESI
jgi:hypothetical protein